MPTPAGQGRVALLQAYTSHEAGRGSGERLGAGRREADEHGGGRQDRGDPDDLHRHRATERLPGGALVATEDGEEAPVVVGADAEDAGDRRGLCQHGPAVRGGREGGQRPHLGPRQRTARRHEHRHAHRGQNGKPRDQVGGPDRVVRGSASAQDHCEHDEATEPDGPADGVGVVPDDRQHARFARGRVAREREGCERHEAGEQREGGASTAGSRHGGDDKRDESDDPHGRGDAEPRGHDGAEHAGVGRGGDTEARGDDRLKRHAGHRSQRAPGSRHRHDPVERQPLARVPVVDENAERHAPGREQHAAVRQPARRRRGGADAAWHGRAEHTAGRHLRVRRGRRHVECGGHDHRRRGHREETREPPCHPSEGPHASVSQEGVRTREMDARPRARPRGAITPRTGWPPCRPRGDRGCCSRRRTRRDPG